MSCGADDTLSRVYIKTDSNRGVNLFVAFFRSQTTGVGAAFSQELPARRRLVRIPGRHAARSAPRTNRICGGQPLCNQ